MPRRQRKKERTRELIRDTALELFATQGYRETTISAIADRCDVAVRTVTLHFPAKEDLLFADDPFSVESLTEWLTAKPAGTSTLDAVRDWMAATMRELDATGASAEVWRRRSLRSQLIVADEDLRGRARAAYYRYEQAVAAGVAADLGLPADALAPRLTGITVITGLRELYESAEARPSGRRGAQAVDPEQLLVLVDRVLDYARAGLARLTN
ncbi:TetR/AcrR family transcriptional regulator [Kribbella flavida]|nr:TetR/AcrR family transcriptional regulator [Kribbella flavida]